MKTTVTILKTTSTSKATKTVKRTVTVYGRWTQDQVQLAAFKAFACYGKTALSVIQRVLDQETLLTAQASR